MFVPCTHCVIDRLTRLYTKSVGQCLSKFNRVITTLTIIARLAIQRERKTAMFCNVYYVALRVAPVRLFVCLPVCPSRAYTDLLEIGKRIQTLNFLDTCP